MYFGKNKFNPNYQTVAEAREWKALVKKAKSFSAVCRCSPVWGAEEDAPTWKDLREYVACCSAQAAENLKYAQNVNHLQGTSA